MIEEFVDIYSKIKPEIKHRLDEFSLIRKEWNSDVLFKEFCFCVLTPQSKAKNAWKAIESLWETNKIFKAESTEIAEELNIVRFKNNKAKYLVNLRNQFYNSDENQIIKLLESDKGIIEKRKWLVQNIKGIGFKEASHYLRNIGFYEEVAILDRHILKNLLKLKVIDEIPKSITEQKYLEIEEKMKQFSAEIKIPMEYLDIVFWYKEAGEIFK